MRRFGKAMAALAVSACTLFGGVATANADENYYEGDLGSTKVGTPAVSDVGAHTANVSFDYQIDPSILPKVQSVCFAVEVMRVTSIKPINLPQFGGNPSHSLTSCSGGTSDGDLTSGSYQSIFGTKTWPVKLDEDVMSYATGQAFQSYDTDMWNHAASGTVQMPVIGLQSNTTYGNTGDLTDRDYTATWVKLLRRSEGVCKLADPTGASFACSNAYDQPVDVRTLYAGMRIVLKDGSAINFGQTAKPISDFTTKAEPTATPAEALPSKTDAKLDVANGHAEPGQTARVYVDNLKAEAKAKADANSLFWNAYIYSEPQALTGPNGSPFVQVQKEASTGKYYFDAVIPAGLPTGEHKISVQDENGTVQAWTPVTVGDAPAPVDKSKLTAAVDAAGKLSEKDYTADSWTPFAKALADAKAVAAKQDASQADVDAAVKALADAQAGLKKAETVPSKPVEPSKPDNGGNNKPSNNNKPANDKPAADDKKSESKNDEQSDLSKTGASVIGVAGILALLAVLAAGLLVVGKSRR
ncbi:hypothetical protein ACK2E9_01185 [Bifidobacterium catenulatum]|uniref:hypothetical protein n=1 Tax=Bifidobacterium catenulatum TaxID=1686 RepID=UPI003D2F138F